MKPGERKRFEAGCAGKDRHASRAAAEAFAAQGRAALEPYRCRFCDAWHLATPIGVQARAPIAKPPAFVRLRHHLRRAFRRRRVQPAAGSAPAPVPLPCAGERFGSEIDAIASARGSTVGVRLRAYACTTCSGWHLSRRGRR